MENKRVEEIRALIKRQLKLKEGAKKIRDSCLNPKSVEESKALVDQINHDIEELRSELNIQMAQVSTVEQTSEVQADGTTLNASESFLNPEKIIQFYKKQMQTEMEIKNGIQKMIEASQGKGAELADNELLILYQDSMVKIESIRMLIMKENQKMTLQQLATDKDTPTAPTADSFGYSLPRLIDLSWKKIKSRLDASSRMLEAALSLKTSDGGKKNESSRFPAFKLFRGSQAETSPTMNEHQPTEMVEFLKQLVVIHSRALAHAKRNEENDADLTLLQSCTKSAVISGTLMITLGGIDELDQEIIKDSKAALKDIQKPRVDDKSFATSVFMLVNLDNETMYISGTVNESKTCFGLTQIEIDLQKNRLLEFIVKSAVSNVMVAFASVPLLEFLDGDTHKIKIPFEPVGYLYCTVNYIMPRPRKAKVVRQDKIFAKDNGFVKDGVRSNFKNFINAFKIGGPKVKKRQSSSDLINSITVPTIRARTESSNNISTLKPVESLTNRLSDNDRAYKILSGIYEGGEKSKLTEHTLTLSSFNLLNVLGQGHFGKVILAEEINTKKMCAIKSITKISILESNDFEMISIEKKVCMLNTELNHPFLVQLVGCFTCDEHICFILEYVAGGDLMTHIHIELFSESRSIFYASCVLLGLEFLHSHGIMYRDLKLDNLLMDVDGYIKIADFGLCKTSMWHGTRTSTFCGTPEFIAPEILESSSYTRAVDWWEFGVLIYEMLIGESPFFGDDENEIFESIVYNDVVLPSYLNSSSKDIIKKLLQKDPARRLGCSEDDAKPIKAHPFFKSMDFDQLLRKNLKPEYVPKFKRGNTTYIDKEFLNSKAAFIEPHKILPKLTNKQQQFFEQFYYSSF